MLKQMKIMPLEKNDVEYDHNEVDSSSGSRSWSEKKVCKSHKSHKWMKNVTANIY